MKRFVLIITALILLHFSGQATVKISLVLSDNFTGTGFEVVRELNDKVAGFPESCEIKVISFDGLNDRDLSFLENSGLIFAYVHQGSVFEQARPSIQKALAKGAKVYALGMTPSEDAYKQLGVRFDLGVLDYYAEGGAENLKNMVLSRLDRDLALRFLYRKVIRYPETGIYLLEKDTILPDLKTFRSAYSGLKPENPWVGIYLLRYGLLNKQHQHLDVLIRAFEREGFNVLPFFGFPLTQAVRQFCTDASGKPAINFLVTTAFIQGGSPDELRKSFSGLGIPVISAVETDLSLDAWNRSDAGIPVFQRALTLSQAELSGQIQPTIFSTREVSQVGNAQYTEKRAVDQRVTRLINRVKSWNNLQKKPNPEKNVALIYYSYPPGKENIGASYLNVLPQSLLSILNRMKAEGYDLGPEPLDSARIYHDVMDHGRNIGNWAPAEVARMVATGNPVLIPVSLYREWFASLSLAFQKEVVARWGQPEDTDKMTWKDKKGKQYFVLPAVRYGKVLLTAQPVRNWGEDPGKSYHDMKVPPPHQYIAFYLFMQCSFHADALIHLGTHGTHEWLGGKEAGLNDDDAPEALIGDRVNIYPYIVDDVGEGLQAKRRGMAVIIDHLTPPFDKAGMNPELRELAGLISDYEAAKEKSAPLSGSKLEEIRKRAEKLGLLKDLGLAPGLGPDEVSTLEHYIKEIAEKQTPFGLHTFGKSPVEKYLQTTAEAIVGRQTDLKPSERDRQIRELKEKLRQSGPAELNALMDALNGRYIEAAQGNDPLRNPSSLPTGKNFYAFDPSKIPAPEVYKTGSRLAEELVENYRKSHNGKYPDKVTFNLWSVETIRHEGVMEAQIMKLLGIRPRYDALGRIKGVEVIPRAVLKRPRIDVLMIPSGLYRDLFPNLMHFLDEAVSLARQQNEQDNFIRQHILDAKKVLMGKGISDEKLAERLASVRMFSVPSGAYGTGLNDKIQESGSWDQERQVAQVYFDRMSHLYGQGFWGTKPETTDPTLSGRFSQDLFKASLSGTKAVVHSRSSNLYGSLDNDDFFQYLGGTAMAVRAVDGETPDVVVTNLSDPRQLGQESLDKFIGRELQSRYLNPQWIGKMLAEGYAGSRMIDKVVSHLWGWQVTVPEAIDENKWQQVYETYVEDKYDLDIREKFREAGNLYAYQTALARMLEVVRKDYWHPDEKTRQQLVREYARTVEEAGLSCNGNVCDNVPLSDFVNTEMQQIKGLPVSTVKAYHQALEALDQVDEQAQVVPHPEKQIAKNEKNPNFNYLPKTIVKGYKLETVSSAEQDQKAVKERSVQWGLLILGIGFILAFFYKPENKSDN